MAKPKADESSKAAPSYQATTRIDHDGKTYEAGEPFPSCPQCERLLELGAIAPASTAPRGA